MTLVGAGAPGGALARSSPACGSAECPVSERGAARPLLDNAGWWRLNFSVFLLVIGVMSAYESALSDAEDDPVSRDGAGDRKRLRSVDDIVQDIEGKKQRLVSPKESGKQ